MKNGTREDMSMIKIIQQENLADCVKVVRGSFATVAEEFNITPENAPRYTAFAKGIFSLCLGGLGEKNVRHSFSCCHANDFSVSICMQTLPSTSSKSLTCSVQ